MGKKFGQFLLIVQNRNLFLIWKFTYQMQQSPFWKQDWKPVANFWQTFKNFFFFFKLGGVCRSTFGKNFTVYRRIESIKIQQDYGGFNRIIGFVDLSSSIQTTESNLPNIETKYKNKHDLRSMCIQEDVICGIFQEYLWISFGPLDILRRQWKYWELLQAIYIFLRKPRFFFTNY